jgi:hypothetical protein
MCEIHVLDLRNLVRRWRWLFIVLTLTKKEPWVVIDDFYRFIIQKLTPHTPGIRSMMPFGNIDESIVDRLAIGECFFTD